MSNWHKLSCFGLLIASALSSGCASMSPFSWFGSSETKTPYATTPGTAVGPGQGVGQRRSAPDPSFTSRIGSSFRSVGDKVSGAFSIKEKVVKAKDPIALDNRPSEVSPDLYVMTAGIYEQQGQFDRAESQYVKALEIAPNHRKAMIGLARLHDRSGSFADAERIYRRAVHLHPQDPTLHNDLGLCLARQHKTQQALSHLQQAINLDPAKPNYRMNLAVLLIDAQQVEAAYQQLAAVHEPAVARYNIGYLLHQQGHQAAAVEQFQRAVAENPELAQARQMLAMLGNESLETDAARVQIADASVAEPPQTPAQAISHVNMLRLPRVESETGEVELNPLPPVE